MPDGIFAVPLPENEPVLSYAPGSDERKSLESRLRSMLDERVEIPLIIGGEEVTTGDMGTSICPHDHAHVLADYHRAGPKEVERAVEASQEAWAEWSEMDWTDRLSIFLKAADLLAGPWRDTVNAATMLGQSKTVYQAEIDSACELIDFWRFNPCYANRIYADQPVSTAGMWNRMEYRPLEGFVFAVTPFNFTSIAGNLPTSPAIMGNTVLWKPASTAVLSGYYILRVLEEAGLPPGVINFLPGSGADVGDPVTASEHLTGLHFTGSTGTFRALWRRLADHLERYRTYPRIVGETGGKDFLFAHPSADVPSLVTALVRGAFEYQGQKCSAVSRAYVPESLWPEVSELLRARIDEIDMGAPTEFRNFMCAVIDRKAFTDITGYIEGARDASGQEILVGGGSDDSEGFFIEPTVIVTEDPRSTTMQEEIFGPVLTVHVYPDREVTETAELCDATSPYGLTGGIFARDRKAIADLSRILRHAAGNFYINDKPTGAVVSQQPFGGARASGTNDKAGSSFNLLRWVSIRSIKETFVPPVHHGYPHMG